MNRTSLTTPKALATKHGFLAISKFEIIGAYFVNLFYNEFYNRSVSIKMSNMDNSITDIYKSVLTTYTEFIDKPEFFKQTVKGVHMYCISTTNHDTINHNECIEWLVSEFIPEKLWGSLRETQKNKLFHDIVGRCVRLFIRKIISECLVMIIDNHTQENNILILQNIFLDIICIEKEKVYANLLTPNVSESVPMSVYKSKIADLGKQNAKLTSTLTALKAFAEKTSKEMKRLGQENETLRKLVVAQQSKLDNRRKPNVEPVVKPLVKPVVEPKVETVAKEDVTTIDDVCVVKKNDENGSLLFENDDDFYEDS